ncbi:MAG: flavodoxin-dependent (E)-4-hydroxy-3-methylbut-2-enyl-diphosphate synthase [Candidatus Omnitrophica bacterium]|nr:flavodoxin-dependent (E)-4-hydroxy-3-methylbut-2-enyl-diphosphate synthase [Candidatus Omnitrophota bacterium]
MIIARHKTRVLRIGRVEIGGNNLIAIQSMTKTKTSNLKTTIKQIRELQELGCEIVRVAVKDLSDARALKEIKENIKIPLVADIHFNWRLAIQAIENGVDKIRLNPGNIYKIDEIKEIVQAARSAHIPIRVGVNSGSLRKIKNQKSKIKNIAEAMIEEALDYIRILEKFKFYDIVVSLKASCVLDTIQAYRKISKICDYPLHLGVTATGPSYLGRIKSSIALGVLLSEGIGDTLRVSLTDTPQEEVRTAKAILEAIGRRSFGPQIISCPTCGRCSVNLVKIVNGLENKLSTFYFPPTKSSIRVAVMGCVVNGPGEARDADLGVAFGRKDGMVFKKGRIIKRINPRQCIDYLLKETGRIYV